VDLGGLGWKMAVDDLDLMVDVDLINDKLDWVAVSNTDPALGEIDTILEVKLDFIELKDGTTEVNSLVLATEFSDFVDVMFGIGVVVLREMSLNVTAGIIPLTTLPRGVIKSRLTALAVNEYGAERFKLMKDPSTTFFRPTTGIV